VLYPTITKLLTIAQVHKVEFFTQISRKRDRWDWPQVNLAERDRTVETMYTMAAVFRMIVQVNAGHL